jgi:hypothetical protein
VQDFEQFGAFTVEAESVGPPLAAETTKRISMLTIFVVSSNSKLLIAVSSKQTSSCPDMLLHITKCGLTNADNFSLGS